MEETTEMKPVLVRLDERDVERLDAIARKLGQRRVPLIRRILIDAIYGPDADTVLAGNGGAKWR